LPALAYLALLLAGLAQADHPHEGARKLRLAALHDSAPLGRQVMVFEDPGGRLELDDVRRLPASRFSPGAADVLNFGYSHSAWWLCFQLEGDPARSRELLLEIAFPSLDELVLHEIDAAGAVRTQRGGDTMPWNAREIKHRNHVFRLAVPQAAERTYFLRVASQSVVTVPLRVWDPLSFQLAERDLQLLLGLFYGLVAALFAYNLLLYAALRDPVYLWYVAYVGAFGVFLFAFDGLAFEHLWPDSVWWANHALATALSLTVAFGSEFARRFLLLERVAPRVDLLARAGFAGGLALAACAAAGWPLSYGTIPRMLSVLAALLSSAVLYASVREVLRGYRPARFFLLAWSALLVFITLGALRNFALAPTNFFTVHGLHIGLALDQANEKLRAEAVEREAPLARLREQEERMRFMAQHDALTGLPNRYSMHERLSLALEFSRRNRKKLAVMVVDLDDFKHVNDTRGHTAGDQLLITVANRLRSSVRAADTVARLGGDEFVVLAADLKRAADAQLIAEKIVDMVSLPAPLEGGEPVRITCSVGISAFPDCAESAEELLRQADRAMYAAKAGPETRVAFHALA
jgi:diguanylate cyclase (GGDEF)-like protein